MIDPTQFLQHDIWMQILSFVGPEQFAFAAGVNRQMKKHYEGYFSAIKKPPKVYGHKCFRRTERAAICSDTFYRAVFSSVSCAKQWAEENDIGRHERHVCFRAAKHGNLEVFKWARQQKFPWNSWTCRKAAASGNLECLKYAHEHGCPWDEFTCKCATENGHLECLQYAHQNGCPWGALTCMISAKHAQLECLQYAHNNGCSWNMKTCQLAAENGHLECLKYAHEKGCEWDVHAGWLQKMDNGNVKICQ